MIQIIAGEKGKGKTKELLDKVNGAVSTANGNVVFLDKSTKHMYELNNKVRLINVCDYLVENVDQFVGFVAGIISQDHDLEELYVDSFLTIAGIKNNDDICYSIKQLEELSEKYNVKFVMSVSKNEADLPDCAKDKIVISL
ncbi:MAG: twitching motility protein PilT [Lachnospiraceae bacterium]|nr:twitching motility protein PilT [Lachnospiraceae bacterium]